MRVAVSVLAFALSTLMAASATADEAAAALRAGDEFVYAGRVVEEGLHPKRKFRRSSQIEVRCLVLRVSPDAVDWAILCILQPEEDAAIAELAVEVAGGVRGAARSAPTARLELIRLDTRSQPAILTPERSPPPLAINGSTRSTLPPLPPADEPCTLELGMFPHRPEGGAQPGDRWTQQAEGRPAMHWTATRGESIDGAEIVEYAAEQASPGWDTPIANDRPWRRTERVWIAPVDGMARKIMRRMDLRDGPSPERRIETQLELKPSPPLRGAGFARVQREIEYAWWFNREAVERPAAERAALAARIRHYCETQSDTPYREAVLTALRRCELPE